MTTLAIITSQAFSLVNFRGPLIRALVEAGVQVLALAPDYDDKIRSDVVALGSQPVDFSLTRTGMNPLRDIADMLRLARLLRSLRPDVVLCYSIKPSIYGTLAAWMAQVPRRFAMIEGLGFVFTDDGVPTGTKRRALRVAVSWLYRLSLSRAEKVIFLNSDDHSEFNYRRIITYNKGVVLGGIGVDLDEWCAVAPHTHPITFLLAARLLREKGINQYAEAARRVKRHHPETRFILLGGLDPNPGGLSHSEVQAWVNEGLLEWPGHVQVKPWLAQTSVYVLPSYREGVPRSTQEAMAMARPVITTDAPGCRETVVDAENGFLVPVRDEVALEQAMLRFIQLPSLIESMGQASRHLAEERFDVNKVNARLLQILLANNDIIKRN